MSAFSLPIPITYDMLTVLLSILPALIASPGALFFASRRNGRYPDSYWHRGHADGSRHHL
ncbi:MHYT domain-containing protein [Plectonema radiosum]|uniref:MHYT domain-containing protein n=1 Tax=Plectonema radiosum TaxID=945768 RepID=UPI0035C92C3F